MARIDTFILGAALLSGLFACSGGKGPSSVDEILGSGTTGGSSASSGSQDGPGDGSGPTSSAVPGGSGGNFLNVDTFPLDLIVSGGVGRDGIPALTDPRFVSATSADARYIADSDPVMGVVIGGEAKAYPHNIGWWHEIVNDVVGGHPVVVSLCPLTGTGMVFDGVDGEGRIAMGVSGWLFNNNLIMYDRRDDQTLFPQITHRAIHGPGKGEDLELMPVVETTWGYWKRLYPNTTVVSGQGDYFRLDTYTGYPYSGYREPTAPPMFPISPGLDANPVAGFHDPKTRTMGLRSNETVKAYPFEAMGKEAVVNDRLGLDEIVVVYYDAEQMAIPYLRQVIHRGNSVTLTFDLAVSRDTVYPFAMADRETRSIWNLKGEAIEGELEGLKLRQLPSHNAFWFAWATFWQNTTVHGR